MTTFTVETIEPQAAAAIRYQVPMDQLQDAFGRGFTAVMQAAQAQGLEITGPPFGYYPSMPTDTVEVVVGFPLAGPVTPDGEVEAFELPGGRAIICTHVGHYDELEKTYTELMAWAETEGLTLAQQMWESYVSDPEAEPDPSTWRTLVVWPLAD